MYYAGEDVLRTAEAGLSRAEPYDRLLSEFARREVHKGDNGLDSEQEDVPRRSWNARSSGETEHAYECRTGCSRAQDFRRTVRPGG